MWKRKELKKEARGILKKNYFRIISVCLIMAVFVGAYYFTFRENGNTNSASDVAITMTGDSNATILEEFIAGVNDEETKIVNNYIKKHQEGVLSNVFNNTTESGSFIFGIINSINSLVFKGNVGAGIVTLVVALITFLFWLFVGNVLRVGENRFMMENNQYQGTRINRLIFVYKTSKTLNVAKIMFQRTMYTIFWIFTVVGGFIKYYEYRMIPFILAENPGISSKEAFALSKSMMKKNKWKTFKLDMSFIGWSILSSITFGFVGYLYSNPYKTLTISNMYKVLRNKAIKEKIENCELLNDSYLYDRQGIKNTMYPVSKHPIPESASRKWITTDYERDYSIRSLILLFFTYSMVGWVWEVLLNLMQNGYFANRGTFTGPWLPIYGAGGVLVLIVLKKFRNNKAKTFFLVFLLCGVLEYATGWYLLNFKGLRWWDYTGFLLNINGIVCLEGLLVFAVGGTLSIYFLAPILDELYKKIPIKVQTAICVVLVTLFIGDIIYTQYHPNVGHGITET